MNFGNHSPPLDHTFSFESKGSPCLKPENMHLFGFAFIDWVHSSQLRVGVGSTLGVWLRSGPRHALLNLLIPVRTLFSPATLPYDQCRLIITVNPIALPHCLCFGNRERQHGSRPTPKLTPNPTPKPSSTVARLWPSPLRLASSRSQCL